MGELSVKLIVNMLTPNTPVDVCPVSHLSCLRLLLPAVVRLRAARRGHLAVGVSGQLRHLLTLIPLAVRRQHGHRHRSHRHGNRLSRLPGGHQGEQVPAPEREYHLHIYYNNTHKSSSHTASSPSPSLLLVTSPPVTAHCCGDGLPQV